MIKFYPVDSSQMAAIGYKPADQILVVQFNSGKYYKYDRVSSLAVAEILFAESVGKMFNSLIKGHAGEHPYAEITVEEAFGL